MNLGTSLTCFHSVWVLLLLRCRLAVISAPVCLLSVSRALVWWPRVYCSVEGQSQGGSSSEASSISPSQHTLTHTHSRMIADVFFSTESWTSHVRSRFPYNKRFVHKKKPALFPMFSFLVSYPQFILSELHAILVSSQPKYNYLKIHWTQLGKHVLWLDASAVSSLHASRYM